jgi:hypothetical protein
LLSYANAFTVADAHIHEPDSHARVCSTASIGQEAAVHDDPRE